MIANFNPKVSIIVAIYKSEPFLDKLIQSLIHQTYKNIEIILVDDGSPDGLMFSCEATQHSNRVGVGHRKVYVYRMNNLNSGLTNYNVQHGLNAYNNIRKIKRDLFLDSEKLRRAADWHIYKNYGFLLLQIIGSGQVDAYRKEYDDCIRHLRRDMLKVLLKSKVNLKEKLKIILHGLFPVTYTRLIMWRSKRALLRDVRDANLKSET